MSTLSTPEKDGHPPVRMIQVGGSYAPEALSDIADTGIGHDALAGLALKLAYTVQHFTTEWLTQQLCLPLPIVTQLLEGLKTDGLVEILGEAGAFSYRYTITGRGREHAVRMMEISGYVGPAPVSLDAYAAILDWQFDKLPEVSPEKTESALSELVLSEESKRVIGFALMSGRSLLVYGPPGNGKTSVGRMLHSALSGSLWIPHCIAVENCVIRLYDAHCHNLMPLDLSPEEARRVDQRWLRIARPFIVVGGELTIEALDLGFNPAQNFYEAPLHLKANGGTFLLDDFGRQRVEPERLLNRWIIPLELQTDFLTLVTGQTVQVPLRQMLVMSTGLDPDEVVDPAFMRRIGYRLRLDNASPERFTQIFDRYAAQYVDSVPSGLLDRLLERYAAEGRPLRCCEPRDLIERARDICRYQNLPLKLNDEIMDLAWTGYFGNRR